MSDPKLKQLPTLEVPTEESDKSPKSTSPVRSRQVLGSDQQRDGSKTTNVNQSPTRSATSYTSHSTIPSAAAVQRALSATRTGSTNMESMLESNKDRLLKSNQNTPSWPTSPRLKSPPPSIIRSMIPRRNDGEHTQLNAAVKRLAPVSTPELGAAMQITDGTKDQMPQPIPRTTTRGTSGHGKGLETVAEGDVSTTDPLPQVSTTSQPVKTENTTPEHTPETPSDSSSQKPDNSDLSESTNKISTAKTDNMTTSAPTSRVTSTIRPESNLAKRSFTSLSSAKNKPTVEPLRTMTVETETVTSTPQVIGDRGRDTGGSVRTKPSNETIRPKKERKKPPRKAPSLHAGTATSKADIFEAKVASAVDEADSSDSDETFVYESNPPEPRQGRHHSRTPSATSVASQADHYGGRNKHGVRSGSTAIPGKKSMKFSSSLYGGQLDAEGSGGDGGRNSTRTQSLTPRHHHIGRYGRNNHASIIDADSPFTQANRVNSPRTPNPNNARHSRPNSPRTSNARFSGLARKSAGGYDTYDDGADDERTPLMGSVRVNRTRYNRKPTGNFRSIDYDEHVEGACWSRFGGCLLLGLLVTVVCIGITTFVVALNRPLLEVGVRHIQNVLASEQELMLDLDVQAINPNLFSIAVSDLDAYVFAESPYAGTAAEWQNQHPPRAKMWRQGRDEVGVTGRKISFWFPPFHQDDGVDEGTDPIDEEPGTQTMLLGRVFEFDSPLIFESSPIRHALESSVGEIRLAKPGNATEVGGSARWERVLQHPFDLIVRGVIKYQLPLSSHIRSAKIGARIKVSPDAEEGGNSTSYRLDHY